MDIESDLPIESRDSFSDSSFGIDCSKLILEIEKIESAVQERISQPIPAVTSPLFDFFQEKESFLQLIKAIPAGPLSVYCQTLWNEMEANLSRIDQMGQSPIREQKEQCFKEYQTVLGKAIFAHQCNPLKAQEIFTGVSPVKEIEDLYTASIKGLVLRVNSFYALETESGFEAPKRAFFLRLSQELAAALLTFEGKLNFPIIPDLKNSFFSTSDEMSQEEKMISRILDQIDLSWQPLIDGVSKPINQMGPSAVAIRGDFHLKPATTIEDLHAKQAVLGALLSLHAQGPIGDCFSVACALKIETEFLKNALNQYGELIHFDSIGKYIGNRQDRFFFKNSIKDPHLHQPILIDGLGKLKTGMLFWEAPNFKFAFRQMGIEPTPSLSMAVLERMGAHLAPIQTTPDQLIKAYAAEALKSIPKTTLDELFKAGRYGFITADNRVLRAFEMALKGVAEARRNEYIRNHLIGAVEAPLQSTYEKLQEKYTHGAVAQFQTVFRKTLESRIRYVYNGAIRCVIGLANQISLMGGFELYERHPYDFYNIGVRIVTPGQFKELILDTVQQTAQSIGNETMISIGNALKGTVSESAYLKAALIAYDPANGKNVDPVTYYSQLFRTPMTSQTSRQPVEIEELDAGLYFSPNLKTAGLNSPSDLLNWVLGFAVWKEKTSPHFDLNLSKEQSSNDPRCFKLKRKPEEGINEILKFVKSGQNSNGWISDRLMNPGRKVANWIVDLETRERYVQLITEHFIEKFPDGGAAFRAQVATLINHPMSLSQFSESLLKVTQQSLNLSDPTKIVYELDKILLEALPERILKIIETTSVRLFPIDERDIYFCVYFNPRLEALSLGIIRGDKTSLAPTTSFFL